MRLKRKHRGGWLYVAAADGIATDGGSLAATAPALPHAVSITRIPSRGRYRFISSSSQIEHPRRREASPLGNQYVFDRLVLKSLTCPFLVFTAHPFGFVLEQGRYAVSTGDPGR